MNLKNRRKNGDFVSGRYIGASQGASPKGRHRVMAQVQYVNSLFGKPIAMSDHKVEAAQASEDPSTQLAAQLARKYANHAGVRFMQNYI